MKSMDDPGITIQTKELLFRKAVNHQNCFRLDATVGNGCDRHLLGLLCASRELGMDIPGIFMDKVSRVMSLCVIYVGVFMKTDVQMK